MEITLFGIYYFTDDFERLSDFYRSIIGLTIKSEYQRADGRRGVIFEAGEHGEFELIEGSSGAQRVGGLRFRVGDVRREYERLQAAGVALGALKEREWGERMFDLRAPDGVNIQIFEMMT